MNACLIYILQTQFLIEKHFQAINKPYDRTAQQKYVILCWKKCVHFLFAVFCMIMLFKAWSTGAIFM